MKQILFKVTRQESNNKILYLISIFKLDIKKISNNKLKLNSKVMGIRSEKTNMDPEPPAKIIQFSGKEMRTESYRHGVW